MIARTTTQAKFALTLFNFTRRALIEPHQSIRLSSGLMETTVIVRIESDMNQTDDFLVDDTPIYEFKLLH